MKTVLTCALIAIAMTATSCGGDDGSSLTDEQQAAADAITDTLGDEGIELDESCLDDLVSELSPADLDTIVAHEGDELSPAGLTTAIGVIPCMTDDSVVGMFVESMADNGVGADEACVREALGQFDLGEVFSSPPDREMQEEFNDTLMACAASGDE